MSLVLSSLCYLSLIHVTHDCQWKKVTMTMMMMMNLCVWCLFAAETSLKGESGCFSPGRLCVLHLLQEVSAPPTPPQPPACFLLWCLHCVLCCYRSTTRWWLATSMTSGSSAPSPPSSSSPLPWWVWSASSGYVTCESTFYIPSERRASTPLYLGTWRVGGMYRRVQ